MATKTNKKRGWIKGKPIRFIQGHNGRIRPSRRIEFIIDPNSGCWIWQRSLTPQGYGHLTINNKQVLAHRFLYVQQNGYLSDNYELDHLCSNKACVNPNHLEPVSHAENCRRGPKAKLNWRDIEIIKNKLAMGITHRELAKEFNVTHTTIGSIARGKAWVNLGGLANG